MFRSTFLVFKNFFFNVDQILLTMLTHFILKCLFQHVWNRRFNLWALLFLNPLVSQQFTM